MDFERSDPSIITALINRRRLHRQAAIDLLSQLMRDDQQPAGRPSALSLLSDRELQVLRLMAEGLAMKEIAIQLKISVKTVEAHRQNLMTKTGMTSVAGLTRFAVREGIAPL
jgi:DNA-binding NarL/FixJ family response regulator